MFSTIQTSQLSSQQPKKASAASSSPLLPSPFKRETMSLTQIHCLAHKAQAKLSAEAQRPNQDLRKLVGSANLLDALILELADAEMEQESWFNQSVCAATNNQFTSSQERRVQWADTVVEKAEEDWEADDTASDSSSEESEEESMPPSPLIATLLSFTEKQHQQKTEDEAIGSSEKSFYSDGYYVPPRNPARLVSAMVH